MFPKIAWIQLLSNEAKDRFTIMLMFFFFFSGTTFLDKVTFSLFIDQKLLSLCSLKKSFFTILKCFRVFVKNYHENSKIYRNQDFRDIQFSNLIITLKIIKPHWKFSKLKKKSPNATFKCRICLLSKMLDFWYWDMRFEYDSTRVFDQRPWKNIKNRWSGYFFKSF